MLCVIAGGVYTWHTFNLTNLSTCMILHFRSQPGRQRWNVGSRSQQLLGYQVPVKSHRHRTFRRSAGYRGKKTSSSALSIGKASNAVP